MSVRPVDIAERLGISRQAINGFINQGMPTDSIESAEAWYNSRAHRRNDNSVSFNSETNEEDKDFAQLVEQHRELKALAYRQYMRDLDEQSPNQSKSYATYDKLVKTLVTLEKELHARGIAAKEYIKTQTAIDRFGKVLLSIRNELSQLPTKLAVKANPDSPGTAMKAIESEVTRILQRLSNQAEEAQEAVQEIVSIEVIKEETVNPQADEIQQDGDPV
jgi:hypothetical protein